MPRLAILLGLVLMVGCIPSLPMVQPHAPAASPGEGIVMGSVLVTIEEPTEKEPSGIFPLIKGANKAERFSYKFFLKKRGEFSPRHHLTVTPGQGEFFATRLPAGNYEFYAMKPKKTVLLGNLRILFEVQPGKTTYIGRMVARLPYKLGTCATAFTCMVEEAQGKCLDAVQGDYPVQKAEVDKNLMLVVGGPYYLNKTTTYTPPVYIPPAQQMTE